MKFLQNVKVFHKVLLLGVIIIAAFTVLLSVYIYPVFKNNMFAAKEAQTKNLTDSAYTSIEHFVELQKNGQMTLEEAQAAALDVVRFMRYDNGNYFWINDLEPKMIMHPNFSSADKPEWYEDGGLSEYADPTGKKLFVEMVKIANEQGEGRVDYEWPKTSGENVKPSPKISYVKLIPDWGWVVGTGIYVDDVQKTINEVMVSALIMILVIIGLSIFVAIALANSIAKPLKTITDVASRLALGDISDNVTMQRKDEIGLLAGAFERMIQYQRAASEVADQMAAGDLTATIQPNSEKDRLGNSFVKMLESLRDAISQVSLNAASLDSAADDLSQASNQAAQATSQIATTIQQVANGSSVQADAISKTASAVDQMSQAINGVAKGAQEQSASVFKVSNATDQINKAIIQVAGNAASVTAESDIAAEAARKGAITIEQTLAGMQSIKQKVGISAEKVEEMGRRSEEIGKIVETIEDISSQTNLLALNAAIEAARAGEYGKGFAVVADEVRKLAERSSLATKEISDLISRILVSVSDAVKAMEDGSQEVEKGVENANQAGTVLTEILNAAEAVNKQAVMAGEATQHMKKVSEELITAVDSVSAVVEENTASTEQMAANTSEVHTAIESIASISEENSASVEEVSASTEEMSAQVEEVTASAQQLSEMSKMLQSVVNRFRLS
jgi:methyl-accepting chemotaxis protein